MDKSEFMNLGFNKSETEIYLTLLRLGKATATKLTKETGIHRTYIYDIIEKLRERGMISQIKEQNKYFFQATDPNRIKEYLLEKVENMEKLLPELNKIKSKSSGEVSVEVYKGEEGMKTILNDIIREGKDYYVIGAVKEFEKILPEIYIRQFVLKVNEKKMKETAILEEETEIIEARKHNYKYLPKEYLSLSSFIIYGDKIALFVWKKPYIQILIKNKDISESYLTQFKILWKVAKSGKDTKKQSEQYL